MEYRAILDFTMKDMLGFVRIHRKIQQKTAYMLRIYTNILLLFCVLFGLYYLSRTGFRNNRFSLYYFLLVGAGVILQFTDYITAWSMLKNSRTSGTVECTFSAEQILLDSRQIHSQYEYDAFSSLVRSAGKRCFLLYIGKRLAVVLPEHCLTEGDPAALGRFLEEKTGCKLTEIK